MTNQEKDQMIENLTKEKEVMLEIITYLYKNLNDWSGCDDEHHRTIRGIIKYGRFDN